MTRRDISYSEALELTLGSLSPLGPVELPLWQAEGHALARDAVARVDSPSLSASAKDGFALRSAEAEGASPERPVRLRLSGLVVAGGSPGRVAPGCAVEVTTGAPLPEGADAVVPVELCERDGADVLVGRPACPGRNVVRRGEDVEAGAVLARAGAVVRPALAGLLAAGGLGRAEVVRRPRVALLGTGDEVVRPGRPLGPGQLHASNLVTLSAWLRRFGLEVVRAEVVADELDSVARLVSELLGEADAVLTSGGAWKSGRDLSPRVVEALGGELVYHRVRLAPGKAAALGLVGGRTVFCLPGGPPSNESAFLQLALPGLLRLAGLPTEPFPEAEARIRHAVRSRHSDPSWTYCFHATLRRGGGGLEALPLEGASRLEDQAAADGLIRLPEGRVGLEAGELARVLVLFDPAARRGSP